MLALLAMVRRTYQLMGRPMSTCRQQVRPIQTGHLRECTCFQQTSTVKDYIDLFEDLSNSVHGFNLQFRIELHCEILAFAPKFVNEAKKLG